MNLPHLYTHSPMFSLFRAVFVKVRFGNLTLAGLVREKNVKKHGETGSKKQRREKKRKERRKKKELSFLIFSFECFQAWWFLFSRMFFLLQKMKL